MKPAPISPLERKAAQWLGRPLSQVAAPFLAAVRESQLRYRNGERPGACMSKAAAHYGHDRDALAQAILDARKADAKADHKARAAEVRREATTREIMSDIEREASYVIADVYGPPPAGYADAIRDVKRMVRTRQHRFSKAIGIAAAMHELERDAVAAAILSMRGAA